MTWKFRWFTIWLKIFKNEERRKSLYLCDKKQYKLFFLLKKRKVGTQIAGYINEDIKMKLCKYQEEVV